MHLTNWDIKEHQIGISHSNLNREHIVNNTPILRKQNDINRLLINEAILITLEKPKINRPDTGISRTLRLFSENVIPQNVLQINNFKLNNFRPDRNLTQITSGNNLIRSVDTGHPLYTLRSRYHLLGIYIYYCCLNFFAYIFSS